MIATILLTFSLAVNVVCGVRTVWLIARDRDMTDETLACFMATAFLTPINLVALENLP